MALVNAGLKIIKIVLYHCFIVHISTFAYVTSTKSGSVLT
jgi:hypothetical protein